MFDVTPAALELVRPGRLLYPLAAWVVMAVLAVGNGAFRETVLTPRLGERGAHLLSTGMLVSLILLVSAVFFRSVPAQYSLAERLAIGTSWVVLTVGFEFLVGYLEGTPVEATLAQYDVLSGHVWIVVPLTLFLAPLLFG
ncbi:MAG: hypothetical protein ABEI31_06195 [Halodesulfurarchaeum sp.]